MVSLEDKEKNILDLEYNLLLNKQNIALILVGTFIISVLLSENFPKGISKIGFVIILFLLGLIFLVYYSKKLEEKVIEIKSLS